MNPAGLAPMLRTERVRRAQVVLLHEGAHARDVLGAVAHVRRNLRLGRLPLALLGLRRGLQHAVNLRAAGRKHRRQTRHLSVSALVFDCSTANGKQLHGGGDIPARPLLLLYASGADVHNKQMPSQPYEQLRPVNTDQRLNSIHTRLPSAVLERKRRVGAAAL